MIICKEVKRKLAKTQRKSLKKTGWQRVCMVWTHPLGLQTPLHVVVHMLWSFRCQSWRNGRWELSIDKGVLGMAEDTVFSGLRMTTVVSIVSTFMDQVLIVSHLFLCAVLSSSVLFDSVTPWSIACQAPLSMGILQARILEWVAMSSSRGSSWPRDQTQVSRIAGRFCTVWLNREALSFSRDGLL